MDIFKDFTEIKFLDEPTFSKFSFHEIFKEASLEGKYLVWKIGYSDIDKLIYIAHGYSDGEIQVKIHKVELTTRSKSYKDQAMIEIRSRYNNKITEGYSDGDENSKRNDFRPMLANKYIPGKTKLNFPIICQAKLDGIRMITRRNNQEFKFTTRNGKDISYFDELKDELKEFFNYLEPETVIDGELYSTDVTFNELSGIARKKLEKDPKEKFIKYFIFDIMDKDNSIFSIRFDKLIKSFKNFTSNTIRKDKKYHTNYLRIVNFTNCNSYEDIKIMHDYFVTEGYEGIILRKDEQYKNTRSSNLLKYKEFDDDEMEIIGFSEGVGTEVGLVIWEVKTNDGLIFTVRPKGDFEERKKLFENGEKYIGKKITVRFQGKSEKGIPRFPIGISIRDYE